MNWYFGHGTIQRLSVGPSDNWATNHGSLGGTGLRLGLGTGSGELVEGGAALALVLAFMALAAAVAVGGLPPRGAAYEREEHRPEFLHHAVDFALFFQQAFSVSGVTVVTDSSYNAKKQLCRSSKELQMLTQ